MVLLWKLEPEAIFWLRIEKTTKHTNKNGFTVGLYETRNSPEPVVEVWFLKGSIGLRFAEGDLASLAEACCMAIALAYANGIAANRRKYERVLEQEELSQRFPPGTKGTMNPTEETVEKLAQLGLKPDDLVAVIESMVAPDGEELLLVCCALMVRTNSWPSDRLYIAVKEFTELPISEMTYW